MTKQNTGGAEESSVPWHNLEQWIRGQVQEFIQRILEDEVTDW
ncbi:MAG: hypothetical protein OEW33_07395 [Nitrospirota bacterium]|nr:hypothetical protein [Nitrospirota bacterium]